VEGREMNPPRVWNKQSIQELLERSDYAVERAVLAIYARQTQEEKGEGGTICRNSMGFSGSDGEWMSHLARDIEGGYKIPFHSLWRIRKHMKRYWRQLVEVANENEARKIQEERGEL